MLNAVRQRTHYPLVQGCSLGWLARLPYARRHAIAPHTSAHSNIAWWKAGQPTPAILFEHCTQTLDADKFSKELRIRLSRDAAHLCELPHGWFARAPFADMIESHHQFIELLEESSCSTVAIGGKGFADVLTDISKHPSINIIAVLRSVYDLAGELEDHAGIDRLNHLLQKICTLRIGMRVLVHQHLQCRRGVESGFSVARRAFQCNPFELAEAAARDSRALCRASLGRAPDIIVKGNASATVAYIPSVLQYMLTELFKNSCKAVVEKHVETKLDADLPVVVCSIDRESDVWVITISDKGCGMPNEVLERIWDFFYSTCRTSAWKSYDDSKASHKQQGVLSGYGVGLPLSRMYARYFGGDLVATSEPGQGTQLRLTIRGSPQEVFP